MMNILMACAGGMSSSIVAQGLAQEAKKHGIDAYVEATHIGKIKEKMAERDWVCILLAPQVRYHHAVVEKEINNVIPVLDIEGLEYTPMGVSQLFDKIQKAVEKK